MNSLSKSVAVFLSGLFFLFPHVMMSVSAHIPGCVPIPAPVPPAPTPIQFIKVEFFQNLFSDAVIFLVRLLIGLVIFFIGKLIIKIIMKIVSKLLDRKENLDPTIKSYAMSLIKFILNIVLLLIVIDVIGIEVVSLGAIFAALVFAVGMALSGMMANFVAGMLIMVNKPIELGDLMMSQGYTGVVADIGMFATSLTTPDGKTVILPNGGVAGSPLTNYTRRNCQRVDLTIGVDYGCDLALARKVMKKVCHDHPDVMKKPSPDVEVCELAANSVNFVVRPWTKNATYWKVYFEIQEFCKLALDDAGIGIPFCQRDVHIVDADPAFGLNVPSNAQDDDNDDDNDYEEDSDYEEEEEEEKVSKKSKKSKKK